MISQENFETIKKITEEFFEKMGFEVEILAERNENVSSFRNLKNSEMKTCSLNLKTKETRGLGSGMPSEAAILIGERGQVLFEIQHLLKAILKKKIKENFYLDLDINDYKKRKNEYLRELARSLAREVVLTKQEKELPAMPAAERRIIHLELAERPDVTSQSIGKEPNRRIIIRPYP